MAKIKNKHYILNRSVKIQESISRGLAQYRITIPTDMIDLLDWYKGDDLHIRLVVGSGMLQIEKVKDILERCKVGEKR